MISSLLVPVLFLTFGFTNQINPSERYNLIIFEGSDWCVNCIRLEKKILNDVSFNEYLIQKNIKLIKIDFPQRKKITEGQQLNNRQFAEKYNFEGVFPTIIISRSDTLFFDKIYYQNQSVEEIRAVLEVKLHQLR
jgi:thioredoxin-related protein